MTKREFKIKLGALITDALESDLKKDDLIDVLREELAREEWFKECRHRAAASY